MTLMTIADTPHSIALGSAIGIFFGFTPLYPLKNHSIDCDRVGSSLQQDRSCDRRHSPRRVNFCDACDLFRGI
jgi:hypothetical protein